MYRGRCSPQLYWRAPADATRVPPSRVYSPECVEGEFCELRRDGVLRSSLRVSYSWITDSAGSLRGERGELRLTSGFSGVRLALLRRVFVLSFLFDYLQALDHLEGKAHHAVLLAQVLDVDGLLVVVDEHLVEVPTVVVETLCPLGHGLVPYLARLLAHLRFLLIPLTLCYPRRQSLIPPTS